MRKCAKLLAAAVLALAALGRSAPVSAVLEDRRGPTPATEAFNPPELIEEFRLRIENRRDGEAALSWDRGATWERIGTVLMPAVRLNPQGYTASAWSESGTVAAVAVNAHHIKVRNDPATGRGTIFSLLPIEFMVEPENYNSYYNTSSSIITDIPAGTGLFGRFGPHVGDPVHIEGPDGLEPLGEDHDPAEGLTYVVVSMIPVEYPAEIVFENRFGGLITVRYADGREQYVGQVLKPAYGVGRFGGSLHTGVGRLRANHSGVICLSTSPVGQVGGFQILPENHGMSPEMKNARVLTQWMVVGPLHALDPSMEGIGPLFKHYLSPRFWRPDPADDDFVDQALARLIWQVRLDHGEWARPPAVTGREDEGLLEMTHVRILLPISRR